MDIFSTGSSATIRVAFSDKHNRSVTPVAVTYRVYDEKGIELVPETPFVFTPGDTKALITVDKRHNTVNDIGSGGRSMRVVVITMTTAQGDVVSNSSVYIVERRDILVLMQNSYQTYEQAILTGMALADLPGWEFATREKRIAALTEAFHLLGKLRYKLTPDLNRTDSKGFLSLDSNFVQSVRLAQVAQADSLLGGEPVDSLRTSGLMSNGVGETAAMFRPGKPLTLPVSARALRYLTGFVTFGLIIGRR